MVGKFQTVKNIYAGWIALLTNDPQARKLAEERAPHCAKCDHAVFKEHLAIIKDEVKAVEGYVCDLCSCPLSTKLRAPDSKCDAGNW